MKLKIIVIGKVHEVGFRLFLLNLAEALLIPKFDVRNIYINKKQAVQVLIEGEEKQLKEFTKRLREEAPERAEIEKIETEEYHEKIRTIEDYRNSLIVEQLNKIVQVGLTMVEKQEETIKELREFREEFQDYRKEFQDYREEFRDYRKEFRDYRGEFREFREEFQDYRKEFRNHRGEFKSFIDEFRDYREEFREFAKRTDENFKLILEKYGEISERLTTILETLREEAKETREILNTLREDAKETREILNTLREESKETRKILDMLRRESKETREKLTKALELLEKAITKLLEK